MVSSLEIDYGNPIEPTRYLVRVYQSGVHTGHQERVLACSYHQVVQRKGRAVTLDGFTLRNGRLEF